MIKLSPFDSGSFRITSPFGWRTLNGARNYHKGIDIVDMGNTLRVTAVAPGIVTQSRIITNHANLTWEWGNYVSYHTDDGYTIYCCHLAKRLVKKGDKVEPGDAIGIMGNTGYSFGAHTHFEVRNAAGSSINAAEYLGLPNIVGVYRMPTLSQIIKDANDEAAKIEAATIRVGDRVRIKSYVRIVGTRRYAATYTGGTFVAYYDSYDVLSVSGDRVVIGKNGVVTAAVRADEIQKV